MKIIYDRQREIYDRLKDQEQQRTILPTEKRSSLSAQTVGQWRQERIMSPLRPLITHGGGRQ